MNWQPFATWLETTRLHHLMVDIFWLFPTCETLHFIGLTVLMGSLMVVDFRVIGLIKFVNMKAAMEFIPIAIIGFLINLITGIMFVFADPFRYFPNLSFQWKMALILAAGANALWFWLGEHKDLVKLADGEDAPFRAKVIAALSLILWVGVIIGGRMIPYVEY